MTCFSCHVQKVNEGRASDGFRRYRLWAYCWSIANSKRIASTREEAFACVPSDLQAKGVPMIPQLPPAFFQLHCDLPREGPGSDRATRQALSLLPPVPNPARIFDLGCGPGRQTLVLAQDLNQPVIAVDFHKPFLAQLEQAAQAQGLAERITLRTGDIAELGEPESSIDLIWAEGCAFAIGFTEALAYWRRLLKPGGCMMVSELAWIAAEAERPEEATDFFGEIYPVMTDLEGLKAQVGAAGLSLLNFFRLPAAEWFPEYVDPLDERIRLLRPKAANDPDLRAALAEQEKENDIFRRFIHIFAYVYLILQRPEDK